jgi:hypothetical protein
MAAYAQCASAAAHVLIADMSIGNSYCYVCHNSLPTVPAYSIFHKIPYLPVALLFYFVYCFSYQ